MFNKKNISRTKDVICEENITFSQLNINPCLLKGLSKNGFKYPSPIQYRSIPMGLLGLDMIIQAKSGTGKTCVFSVLSLESINISSNVPQVLILSPTREIAMQSQKVITSISSYYDNLSCHLFIGGTRACDDLKKIKNCHIAVGTPGRIRYLIEEKHFQVDAIRLFVLDEADMLFADNFQNIISWIYNSLPLNKQMITLSATYTEDMIGIISKYMNSPVMIRLNKNEKAALFGIKHYYKEISNACTAQQIFWSKTEVLMNVLSSIDFQQCIVFSNYQSIAQDLCEALESKGWSTAYISGNLDQHQRTEIFNKLKNFHCRVLVATDLISRGIDAENVNLVVNLEVPLEFETYLHRMGRAGRYGSYGAVINIVTTEEKVLLDNIKNICDIKLESLPDVIQCDLLDEGFNAFVDDVIIEKMDDKNTNNIYKLFNLSKGDESAIPVHEVAVNDRVDKRSRKILLLDSISDFQRKFKSEGEIGNFVDLQSRRVWYNSLVHQGALKYQMGMRDKLHLQQTSNKIDHGDSCQRNTAEEMDCLELEYNRLYSWASHYSKEYIRVTNLIDTANSELNELIV